MEMKEIMVFCVFHLLPKGHFPGFAYVDFKGRTLCFEVLCCFQR